MTSFGQRGSSFKIEEDETKFVMTSVGVFKIIIMKVLA
jgi:hypothetical protein